MRKDGWQAFWAILTVVGILALGIWMEMGAPAKHRARAEEWASLHGYRLAGDLEKHFWSHGPFWYCDDDQTIYSIRVENGDHQFKELWLRTGAFSDDFAFR